MNILCMKRNNNNNNMKTKQHSALCANFSLKAFSLVFQYRSAHFLFAACEKDLLHNI